MSQDQIITLAVFMLPLFFLAMILHRIARSASKTGPTWLLVLIIGTLPMWTSTLYYLVTGPLSGRTFRDFDFFVFQKSMAHLSLAMLAGASLSALFPRKSKSGN